MENNEISYGGITTGSNKKKTNMYFLINYLLQCVFFYINQLFSIMWLNECVKLLLQYFLTYFRQLC